MPVTIFRRHSQNCPHRDKGRKWERCGCRITIDKRYAVAGGRIETLATTDWQTAQRIARDVDLGLSTVETVAKLAGPVTLAHAQAEWETDPAYTALVSSTARKHVTLHKQLREFAAAHHVSTLAEIDPTFVARFRASWERERVHPTNGRTVKDNPLAAAKKSERLRQFFNFVVLRGWLKTNPMQGVRVKTPEVVQTAPFEEPEIKKLFEAIEALIAKSATPAEQANWQRLRSLVLLMLCSGLRISDATACQIAWIKNGRVQIAKAIKNGRRIDLPLPPAVCSALGETPAMGDFHWFWTGKSALETATKQWQAKLLRVFRAAGIRNGHAHRFRDTFAVGMLERGETLFAVAEALGDSYEVVKRHYNPWNQERQARLDKAVSGGWQGMAAVQHVEAQARRRAGQAVVTIPRRAAGGGR